MRETTPVEVSLCTTHTALMRLSASARSFFSIASGSAPWRQSPAMNSTSSPSFAAIFCHSVAKWPVSTHQHAVAGRQRVDQRRFPRAGAGSGIDHHFALRALEHALHSGEDFLADRAELRAAMVHRREIDRAQHAVGHVGRARDLQEVAAGTSGHWVILTIRPYERPLDPGQVCAGRAAPRLAARLRKELDGEVLFDAASRGRYSTDASIYQIAADRRRGAPQRRSGARGDRHRGRGRASRSCRAAPAAPSAARRSARRSSSTTPSISTGCWRST